MKYLAIKILLAGIFAVLLVCAGKEILYPVATVILGGLVSSTLLDFRKNPAAFSMDRGREYAHNIQESSSPGQTDDDDHGLPPSGIVEIAQRRDKHACPIGVSDDGMVAVIDS